MTFSFDLGPFSDIWIGHMSYNPKDHYYKKAKDQNFAARSVFKLEEIDHKFKIVKPGQMILDLGASPGSWSQFCSQKIGRDGRILGVDLSPVNVKLGNAEFIQADLRDLQLEQIFTQHGFTAPFDLVLSDMAPRTTGIRITDQARSMELCELALDVARRFLKPGGHFVCKLFHSDDFTKLRDEIKKSFDKFEAVKPDSTRKISKEIFLVGIKKKA
jgi:23S rRNA (uridine2552-2'-O)-methyltransferase